MTLFFYRPTQPNSFCRKTSRDKQNLGWLKPTSSRSLTDIGLFATGKTGPANATTCWTWSAIFPLHTRNVMEMNTFNLDIIKLWSRSSKAFVRRCMISKAFSGDRPEKRRRKCGKIRKREHNDSVALTRPAWQNTSCSAATDIPTNKAAWKKKHIGNMFLRIWNNSNLVQLHQNVPSYHLHVIFQSSHIEWSVRQKTRDAPIAVSCRWKQSINATVTLQENIKYPVFFINYFYLAMQIIIIAIIITPRNSSWLV